MPFLLPMLESNVTFLPQLRGTFWRTRSPLRPHPYRGASEVFVEHSSTNTKRSESIEDITITRKAALTNSSRSLAPSVLFSAEAHRADRPREGRLAHRDAGRLVQILLPLFELGEWTIFYVGFQQLPRLLVERGSLTGSLPRRERTPLAHRLEVTLHRGAAHPESASGLALVHAALLDGLDYLPSEIFRISIHQPTMAHGPTSSQIALGRCLRPAPGGRRTRRGAGGRPPRSGGGRTCRGGCMRGLPRWY